MGLLDPNMDAKSLAAQNTFMGALLGRLMPTAPLGTGMAAQAAAILQSRPYQLHVQEAKALGQTPLTPEQFAATQTGLLPTK